MTTPPTSKKIPGQFVSRYKLESQLGSGGMGVVYKAWDPNLEKYVALKVLIGEDVSDESRVRFQQEAKALKDLRHQSFPEVYNFAVSREDEPYMVMELIDGVSLKETIEKDKRLSVKRALEIVIDISLALAYAHSHGIVHRDIKPANIIILGSQTKVIDFGVAKLETALQDMTQTGKVIGSPMYMSPEQIRGQSIDGRSDIYSLGCVFYELLTGRPPFQGLNALETVMKQVSEEPPSLEGFELGVSDKDPLEELVQTCLAKSPEDRYQNMIELQDFAKNTLSYFLDLEEQALSETLFEEPEELSLDSLELAPKPTWTVAKSVIAGMVLLISSVFVYQYVQHRETAKKMTVLEKPLTVKDNHWANSKDRLWYQVKRDSADLKPEEVSDKTYAASDRVTDKDFPKLKELLVRYQVQNICISTSKVNGSGFRHLVGIPIKSVQILSNQLDDNGLKELSRLKPLREVSIADGKSFTNKGLAELCNCKSLKKLDFSYTNFPEGFFDTVSKMPQLEELILSECGPLSLSDLKKLISLKKSLKTLRLVNSGITSDYLPTIASFKKLAVLDLVGNKIDDRNIELLAALPLEKILLASNPISSKTLEKLTKCKTLKVLNIVNCKSIARDNINDFSRRLPACLVEDKLGKGFGPLQMDINSLGL